MERSDDGTRKLRQRIREPKGWMEFFTGSFDGLVSVCIYAATATPESPSRFSLNMTRSATRPENDNDLVSASPIANEIRNMELLLQELYSMADSNRERTVGYNRLTVALNEAVQYWPMMKIVILMIAGVVQVHYILERMKVALTRTPHVDRSRYVVKRPPVPQVSVPVLKPEALPDHHVGEKSGLPVVAVNGWGRAKPVH